MNIHTCGLVHCTSDTTPLWVVGLLELWRNSGDDALVAELYPTAARAVGWLISNAAPLGLRVSRNV
jgi:glycogen debranching enzyme